MATCVLSLDLGTTAVKASVVEDAPALRVVDSASADADAYLPLADARLREQDVGRILAAVEAATSKLDPAALRRCGRIAIADQMHGVVAFARSSPTVTRTPLVTWEDQRVPAAALGVINDRLRAAGLPPVFSGYGWATLATAGVATVVEGSPFQRLLSDCDAACTIGTYLSHVLTGGAGGVWIDTTDCASLGCYDATATRVRSDTLGDAAAGALARFVPAAVVPPGTPRGRLDRDAAASLGLTTVARAVGTAASTGSSTAPSAGVAPVTVHCSVGDHPASVAGAMVLLHQRLRGEAAVAASAAVADMAPALPTVLINVGTSAQAAALGAVDIGAAMPAALPAGCELRPAIRAGAAATPWSAIVRHAAASDAAAPVGTALVPPSPLMLVAASMNGGNVLAFIAARLAVSRRRLPGGGGDAGFSLADAYALLEERALPLLPSSGSVDGCTMPLARVGGRCLPVIAGKHIVLPTLVPERQPVYATAADAGADAAHWTDGMPVDDRHSETAGASASAGDDSALKVWTLPHLPPSLYAPDSLDTLAAVYAGAAASMVFNACSMLPAVAWAQAGLIVLTGAAFSKSKVLLAVTQALLPVLHAAALAASAVSTSSPLAVAAADTAPLAAATAPAPPPVVNMLSVEEMQSAGALGAAAAAIAAAGGVV